MTRDLLHGIRLLRHSPGFTAIAVGAIALGIGANTAIFSTVDAVLLRPLAYADPDRVVMLWEDSTFSGFPKNTPASGNFSQWRARNHVFSGMAATRGLAANLTVDGPPEQVIGRLTTANFFKVLGVSPILGRTFTEEEDRTGAPVAVISYGLWQRRYDGRGDVVGRDILINGLRHQIIGVMPREFSFRNREVQLWAPVHFTPAQLANTGSHSLNVVARLKPGVTLAQARQEMNAIGLQLSREFPQDDARIPNVVVSPIAEDVAGDTRVELLVLMGAAGCVLLIACANLAGLLLARGLGRRREMAVRAALGASRKRLVMQMVAEGGLVALGGGVLGVLLAPLGIGVLEKMVPTALPASVSPAVDVRVLLFALAVSIATGLAFSIVPAWQASRVDLNDALKQGGRGGISGASAGARDALVVLEVAAALVLLIGAGLMLKTVARLRAVEIGFVPDHLMTMRTTLPEQKYRDPAMRISYYRRVLEGVRAIPGVTSAAFISELPFRSRGNTQGYRIEGREDPAGAPMDATLRVSSGDYLQTMGVRVAEGRLLEPRDGEGAPPVVVINETLARVHFPKESALGHRLALSGRKVVWRTIVGVVKDVHERGYQLEMKTGVYLPFEQATDTWAKPENLAVRTAGDPEGVANAVRQVIRGVDPEQPVAAVATMDEILDKDVADREQQMQLLTAFAGLALLLAMLGVYGVLSYTVTQRSREIGLRMALGASAPSVVRAVVARGVGLAGVGLVLGMGLAWGLSRSLTRILYGVTATDPATYAGVAGLLCGIVALACWVPARRASRIDPIMVLREE